jgi:aryl-alcohol dehydrogenase-like predicted oxidoreductase
MPEGSRAKLPGYEWLQGMLTDPKTNERVRKLKVVADDLGCTLAQLSLAWCTKNPHVSTVITGASRASQVHENMAALDVAARLDDDVMARIEEAVPFRA